MRLGIGGGIGPLRGGISTRGVGGGMGPLSAGTSWNGCGAGLVGLIILGVGIFVIQMVYLVVAFVTFWPYMVGTWAMTSLGVPAESGLSETVAWSLEALYATGIAAVFVSQGRRKARSDELTRMNAEIADAETEIVGLEEERDRISTAIRSSMSIRKLANTSPRGLDAGQADEFTKVSIPQGEWLLAWGKVALIEPRVAYRNGPKVLTPVDHGLVTITDVGVRFESDTKHVGWTHAKLIEYSRRDCELVFKVSNRKTISGVKGPTNLIRLLEIGMLRVHEFPMATDTTIRLAQFERELASQVSRLDADLEDLRSANDLRRAAT